ncbi:hypothetical protein [Sphingomicrobium nitratireducens]|uniref:hypothetical protein n=1 Tax=Sphingomicrobium nitratireducens TaxID=2964666 RepID=UPI00223F8365|nr:hypothetical protein [Sphingomicrobium nitratireducens]
MNSSNDSSASAGTDRPSHGGSKSASRSSSHTTEEFGLTGPSAALPDPLTHAYRKDLADVALAGTVIASHYAQPVARSLRRDATLRSEPDAAADAVTQLEEGAPFDLLDSRGHWAWGYGGPDRLVGYVPIEALS